MNSSINYSLLTTARLLRGETQMEVAKAVGIPQGSLSKAESGLLDLPSDALSRLFKHYDLPESFFLQTDGISPTGTLYYRRRSSVSKKAADALSAKVRIFRSIIDKVMGAIELPEYTLDSYRLDEDTSAKEIARRVRHRLKIHVGAVPNLATLLENNGVIVIRIDFGTDKIDGVSTTTEANRKVIFINDQMPNDRVRFSLAHELGHLVMHLDNPICSIEEAEEQADEFASEFLMPEDEIRPMLYNVDFGSLGLLKKRWRVSMRALVRRAKDLEAITHQQYRNLQILFSKYGYTKNEPIQLPLENPTLWRESLNLYKDELGYTDKDLMTMMRLNRADFESWAVNIKRSEPEQLKWYRNVKGSLVI